MYGSNKYYVTSQANYETVVQSVIFPGGFADYEGKNSVNMVVGGGGGVLGGGWF